MTKLLYVYSDGDYGAMQFEKQYKPQAVYEQMVAEGVSKRELPELEYGGDIYVEIKEFGEVDSEFVSFMYDKLIDYDVTKAQDIFFVEDLENGIIDETKLK